MYFRLTVETICYHIVSSRRGEYMYGFFVKFEGLVYFC